MPGRLYNLGSYPGAIPSSIDGEWIYGEHYAIESPRWLLEVLDHYEGPKFARVPQHVYLDSSLQLAWVYLYRCRGNPPGARILSGDWLRP